LLSLAYAGTGEFPLYLSPDGPKPLRLPGSLPGSRFSAGGNLVEWIKDSSCGVPWTLPSRDTGSDGDRDSTVSAAMTSRYDVRKDLDLYGAIGANDPSDLLTPHISSRPQR